MTDRQFEDAWRLGHIEFLGSAWGARPDYFRRLRTQPYKAGTGWQRTRTAEAPRSTERDAAVPDLRRAIFDPLKHPSGGEKLRALAAINDLLSPPAQLAGVFLPPGRDPSFDFIILGEMPSMNEPSGTAANSNFNFNVTAGDRFLQADGVEAWYRRYIHNGHRQTESGTGETHRSCDQGVAAFP